MEVLWRFEKIKIKINNKTLDKIFVIGANKSEQHNNFAMDGMNDDNW